MYHESERSGMAQELPDDVTPLRMVFEYPTRIRILSVLIEADGPLIQKEILDAAEISRPSFSEHADRLVELGLIQRRERTRAIEYELADSDGVELLTSFNSYLDWKLRNDADLEAYLSDVYY